VAIPEPKREKKPLGLVPGPCNYSPRFDAVEAKRDKGVQNWVLSLKALPSKGSAPNISMDNQILSVISKTVKKQKEKLTQDDIDKEDAELISTLIDRFSGGQPFFGPNAQVSES
jgi:hypothetical protein